VQGARSGVAAAFPREHPQRRRRFQGSILSGGGGGDVEAQKGVGSTVRHGAGDLRVVGIVGVLVGRVRVWSDGGGLHVGPGRGPGAVLRLRRLPRHGLGTPRPAVVVARNLAGRREAFSSFRRVAQLGWGFVPQPSNEFVSEGSPWSLNSRSFFFTIFLVLSSF
jgi:hypothetical protein